MSGTHNKLQHGNKFNYWKFSDLVVDLNYFSFFHPNPNPTYSPEHEFLSPDNQFYQRIWHVEYYSVHASRVWSQKFRMSEISLDTGSGWKGNDIQSKSKKIQISGQSWLQNPYPAHHWSAAQRCTESEIFDSDSAAASADTPTHFKVLDSDSCWNSKVNYLNFWQCLNDRNRFSH